MLYPKNQSKTLDMALFAHPTSEYRATPFWAWNCDLTKELLERQIGYLKQMGMGGFHMHARTGLSTPYLGEEYLSLIRACVDKAEQEDMLAWLYDEDRWPSGGAGGLVTKYPKYRQRMLLFTQQKREDDVPFAQAVETGKPYLLGVYHVKLDDAGCLKHYERVEANTPASGAMRWYAYAVAPEPSPWYNGQTYVDTLNPEAVAKFIEITYEAYEKTVGESFGGRVPAIFTDEPQFARKETLAFPESEMDVHLPWTMKFTESFQNTYGVDILEYLPELFWDLPDGGISVMRYRYHDHTAELFATAFADQCGDWCQKHGLMLTGHMMEEPTLESQTHALGEAMRSYRSFQLPGIDMLCDRIELSTAKQAQSASRQFGREGVLSELYGVTDWDFDFRGHKFQGDWQAALGVTVRVPHLSWVSMRGEAKRDYPASINYQSAWFKEYPYVEDHFARLNTALTRGKAVVKVAVVHPVESYWLFWGPRQTSYAVREQREKQFDELVKWLLLGGIDFDFISESLLPEQCQTPGAPLLVGQMQYDAVVVPDCITLRQTTVDILQAFQQAGGRLIFAGECPTLVDATPSDAVRTLFDKACCVPYRRTSILDALEAERLVEIRNTDGRMASDLLYQLRQDGDDRWLFIAHGVKYKNVDVSNAQTCVITVDGIYTPVLYNTIDGSTQPLVCTYKNGKTQFTYQLYSYDSLLVRLEAGKAQAVSAEVQRTLTGQTMVKSKVSYTLHEPNVLLLDQAEYALDGAVYQPSEEILRLDNKCREILGFPPREDAIVQPWATPKETVCHTLSLRFVIHSKIVLPDVQLAVEDAEQATIVWNGAQVAAQPSGYYVDESIQTVALPGLQKGENVLELTLPFGRTTNTEWCYLLGDFDVQVVGCERTILPASREIAFGDMTTQGLPYYGGNLTYQMEVKTPACALGICVPHYRGAVVRVKVDGKEAGVIAYDPYEVIVENTMAGRHKIELTLFGTRFNSFGGVHNTDAAELWAGPNYWRSTGDRWCYEYRLRKMGILSSPIFRFYDAK